MSVIEPSSPKLIRGWRHLDVAVANPKKRTEIDLQTRHAETSTGNRWISARTEPTERNPVNPSLRFSPARRSIVGHALPSSRNRRDQSQQIIYSSTPKDRVWNGQPNAAEQVTGFTLSINESIEENDAHTVNTSGCLFWLAGGGSYENHWACDLFLPRSAFRDLWDSLSDDRDLLTLWLTVDTWYAPTQTNHSIVFLDRAAPFDGDQRINAHINRLFVERRLSQTA